MRPSIWARRPVVGLASVAGLASVVSASAAFASSGLADTEHALGPRDSLLAGSSSPVLPTRSELVSAKRLEAADQSLFRRHGDHDEEEGEEETMDVANQQGSTISSSPVMDHGNMDQHENQHQAGGMSGHMDATDADSHHDVQHGAAETMHSHENDGSSIATIPSPSHISVAGGEAGHDHSHGGHSHAPSPADLVPAASEAGSQLIPMPALKIHGGHSHGGSGAPKEHLNETTLFRAKGPDPLSYIEWDMAYGVGSLDQLQRFMGNQDVLAGTAMMGAVDGRWRRLFDERDVEQRKAIAADIASRIVGGQAPARHGTILALHVVTAVLSCFVLLPIALFLRAAYSNLAPLASLVYLATLGLSMFLSVVYKALTPRLYPDNSHGGMGWAIFWISLVCLGSDVFKLIGQTWSVVRSLGARRASKSALLPASGRNQSWRDVVSTMLGRDLPESSEKYDALEEEAMLSEEGQSDAREVDIENDLVRRLEGHRRTSNGSPHRVHFEQDDQRYDHQEANWVGSGSTAVGVRSCQNSSHAEPFFSERMVGSPTSTACDTPRNSVLGISPAVDSVGLGIKSVAAWRNKTESTNSVHYDSGVAAPASVKAAGPGRASRGPLQTAKTIVRYGRVVAARSLPIIAFAASYTGLAVYTGSCRGGYKNVCLAHGIKGGIFFWYGLFSFARYLGAYADCGWAWNKPPSLRNARKQSHTAWRRSMPSAEFIECLVIFVYGSTNTWMERFGAKAGDPYTIKQIQHISIAVMFWFAGLVGMLLETRWIRNLLSFPVAYHHTAAMPLEELRSRRRSSRRQRRGASHSTDDSHDELEELVEAQTQPASYSSSFNPFPALVIGVTGVAMAAHHQDYIYEVQIHMLWGQLLAGFAILRCLTYFFLWLRPPAASVLPSRPPTEALASFSLCCGGLIFMLSSEEVSFAAMRSGYGDFMAILNVGVALVSLLFCWTTALMVIKGWAVRREIRRSIDGGSRLGELRLATAEGDDGSAMGRARSFRATVIGSSSTEGLEQPSEAVFVLDDGEGDDQDDEQKESRQQS